MLTTTTIIIIASDGIRGYCWNSKGCFGRGWTGQQVPDQHQDDRCDCTCREVLSIVSHHHRDFTITKLISPSPSSTTISIIIIDDDDGDENDYDVAIDSGW